MQQQSQGGALPSTVPAGRPRSLRAVQRLVTPQRCSFVKLTGELLSQAPRGDLAPPWGTVFGNTAQRVSDSDIALHCSPGWASGPIPPSGLSSIE